MPFLSGSEPHRIFNEIYTALSTSGGCTLKKFKIQPLIKSVFFEYGKTLQRRLPASLLKEYNIRCPEDCLRGEAHHHRGRAVYLQSGTGGQAGEPAHYPEISVVGVRD